MSYYSLFIAGAANTVSTGTTWIDAHSTTLIIYALSNCVAVADTKHDRVLCTLRLSQIDDKINVLRTIEDANSNSIIVVSGSEKGYLNVWKLSTRSNDATTWTSVYDSSEMKGAVCTFSAFIVSDNLLVCICDTTGYSKLLLANLSPDEPKITFKLIQSINFHPQQLPNSVQFMPLSSSCLALVVGSVDAKLHIYTAPIDDIISVTTNNSNLFKSSGSLPGHEEWITSLSSIVVNQNTTFLASSSQDCKIRLWKFVTQDKPHTIDVTSTATVTTEEEEDDDDGDDGEDEGEEGTEKQAITVMEEEVTSEARLQFPIDQNTKIVYVFLESLLVGHEDWVTSVSWMPKSTDSQGNDVFKLFSTSMDRNMVIWSPDATAGGVWMPIVRVGDIGGALGGSIGGNLLGFVGGCPSPDGLGILGIGYGGSFHYWKQHETENRWFPVPFLSGHFAPAHDIAWEVSQGQYLISVSSDQTCRLFAPLKAQQSVWKEISRPEIHGYDLNCVALSKTSNIILTAGEEKIIRGFDVPGAVLRGLKELADIELPFPSTVNVEEVYIPELGLSNKGKDMMSSQERKEQEARSVAEVDWKSPPLESQLADHTLWLEVKKLFGHNNEVVCMSLSADGKFLASSSKARYSHSCFILVWSIESYEVIAKLPGHESTVVCLNFSPDGRFLASSGKDRALCIYEKQQDKSTGKDTFVPILCMKNVHKRIIWDMSWSEDGTLLTTVSRDGYCKVWKLQEDGAEGVTFSAIHSFNPFNGQSITAIAMGSQLTTSEQKKWLFVVGSEQGNVQLCAMNAETGESEILFSIPSIYAHGKTVKKLKWRPRTDATPTHQVEWASCGDDHSVRIHRYNFL